MSTAPIEVDYLVVGAGATGMAFVDSILAGTNATVAMVDRHDRPGGHWNDAYPFVRLHQPSSSYGINSQPLGSGAMDRTGLNRGMYELASGQEVLAHFDLAMRHTFLPSGRVSYFPMSDATEGGVVTSLISGESRRIAATKTVDATWSKMSVPLTTKPSYTVDEGVSCVPVNDLPRRAGDFRSFVVIGAGKTGMDACIWLLENGAHPDTITWIAPRDSWILDRANVQPGEEFFARFCQSLADQVEAAAEADSVEELFLQLEAVGEVRRIDPSVLPEAYHCALVSGGELDQLKRISNVVRLGRVEAIDAASIALEGGSIPTDTSTLHVDCSAAGIPTVPTIPVFDGDRITLQWVRTCQPTFSSSLIGFVEATVEDEIEKNRLCMPIAPPTVPRDWLRMLAVDLVNRRSWSDSAEIGAWLTESRLDPFAKVAMTQLGNDLEATSELQRYATHVAAALANLERLLSEET